MINKNFIEDSTKLIDSVKSRGIKLANGNVLVAKVKMDRISAGGITLVDDYVDREEYKAGFGRIIALPEDFGSPGDAKLSVGQYVIFSHEARYKPYLTALREIFRLEVIDNFLYTVQDNEIIMTVEAEAVHV